MRALVLIAVVVFATAQDPITDGQPIQLYHCYDSSNAAFFRQRWVVTQAGYPNNTIALASDSYRVDITDWQNATGTQIHIWEPTSMPWNQQWSFSGVGLITSRMNGLCLDAPSGAYASSGCVTNKCDANSPTQQFRFDEVTKQLRLVSDPTLCLDAGSPTPNFQGCLMPVAKPLPYCNTSLSYEQRVQDLISRLTLDEKIGLLGPPAGSNGVQQCTVSTLAVPRLGVPAYMWLVETNTGVASQCYAPGKCATTFPGPEGLGASFNRSSWQAKGDVISTELRAFANNAWYRGLGPSYLIGLDGFGPNINIVRDPRFGRNSELPGEDPFLTGSYAAAYVSGIQQTDSKGYVKMLAYLKHYDAYSVETNRGHDTYTISQFDFFDTYLPQYERAFTEGHASGVMCSYNGENGHPSCANGWLLNGVIRSMWNQPDALVMTDCGAVSNMMGPPLNAPSGEAASAWSINNGTDIEAGSTVWAQHMHNAVTQGLTSEAAIDASLRRAMLQLMSAGHFDSPAQVSWTSIGIDQVNSSLHQQVNYEAALQSFVLLKNQNNTLPLKAGRTIAVVGPQGIAQYGLLSDYFGDQVCFGGGYDCIAMIGESIAALNTGGTTLIQKGVDVNSQDQSGIPAALAAVKAADVVVLALGIDKTIEYEGVDRTTITLPGLQESFAQQVLAIGKPTVFVLTNGGEVAIDNLIAGPQAIVEAFNPSVVGAKALAATLFGQANRWGKLPITMYPANYVNQQPMTNFDMSVAPGRTYRYYQGTPLFPFGYGLSLTTFGHSCVQNGNLSFVCKVSNTGTIDGDEVIQVYHSAGSDIRNRVNHPVPFKSLVEFERVTVAAGSTTPVQFQLDMTVLMLTNLTGSKVLYSGDHNLIFSRGYGADQTFVITV